MFNYNYKKFLKELEGKTKEEVKALAEKKFEEIKFYDEKHLIFTMINENFVEEFMNSYESDKPLRCFIYDLKEAFFIKNRKGGASTNMLTEFENPYDSTVFRIMKESGAVLIGITNSDEYSTGIDGSTTAFGVTVNEEGKLPGGSTSGGAVSAKFISHVSYGTDTGGSCRQPGIINNIIGYKPTFGAISRFGVIEYANSLDTVGMISRCAENIQEAAKHVIKYCTHDACSVKVDQYDRIKTAKNTKILVISGNKMTDSQKKYLQEISNKGIEVEARDIEIDLPATLSMYDVISSIEFFSSLNKYDCIKHKDMKKVETIYEPYYMRNQYLHENSKFKILSGACILYDKELRTAYHRALKSRTEFIKYMDNLYNEYYKRDEELLILFCLPEFHKENSYLFNEEGYIMLANFTGDPSTGFRNKYGNFILNGRRSQDHHLLEITKQIK